MQTVKIETARQLSAYIHPEARAVMVGNIVVGSTYAQPGTYTRPEGTPDPMRVLASYYGKDKPARYLGPGLAFGLYGKPAAYCLAVAFTLEAKLDLLNATPNPDDRRAKALRAAIVTAYEAAARG